MLKIAFNSLCMGMGGADAFMMALIHNIKTVECIGVAVQNDIQAKQYDWMKNVNVRQIPVHQKDHNSGFTYPEIMYHDKDFENIKTAGEDADIIVNWGLSHGQYIKDKMGKCLVDFSQNGDSYFEQVCTENDPYTDFRVACSKSAVRSFPIKSRDSVTVIYNGIDPNRVTPRLGRKIVRENWGYTEDQKILLYMGRFCAEKNPEALIQAVRDLPEEWQVVYCGGGELQNKLEEEAARYAPGRVAFIPTQYHMGDVLAMADVFMLPTDFEGHPLAWCEAVLAGLPTVVSDIPAMRELHMQHGQLAVYVPRRASSTILAQAVLKADSESNYGIRARARQVCWENWVITRIATQWEEFLHEAFAMYNYRKRHPKIKRIIGQLVHRNALDSEESSILNEEIKIDGRNSGTFSERYSGTREEVSSVE